MSNNNYASVGGGGSSDGKNLHEMSAVRNNSSISSIYEDEDATTGVNCQHPIVKSFHLTQFMVFWIAPLFEIADKRQLLDTDVWSLPPSVSVHNAYDKFWRTWEAVRVEDSSKGEKTSLYRVLVRCYFKEFIYSGLLQLVFMLFQLGQPFLIIEIVKYVATGNGGIGLGIGLALALGCVSLCSSLSLATSLYLNRILGIEVKAGLMTAVYKQSLNLTSESRLSYSVGQITNLVAIDADKIFMAVQFPHFLWLVCLQLYHIYHIPSHDTLPVDVMCCDDCSFTLNHCHRYQARSYHLHRRYGHPHVLCWCRPRVGWYDHHRPVDPLAEPPRCEGGDTTQISRTVHRRASEADQ